MKRGYATAFTSEGNGPSKCFKIVASIVALDGLQIMIGAPNLAALRRFWNKRFSTLNEFRVQRLKVYEDRPAPTKYKRGWRP